jgi:hypothetical protein
MKATKVAINLPKSSNIKTRKLRILLQVPFIAQPSFNGEYDFNIHGLHFIDASKEFQKWNKDKQVTKAQN